MRKTIILLACLVMASAPLHAQPSAPDILDQIEAFWASAIERLVEALDDRSGAELSEPLIALPEEHGGSIDPLGQPAPAPPEDAGGSIDPLGTPSEGSGAEPRSPNRSG